jgi:ABC-type transporter MlaC component
VQVDYVVKPEGSAYRVVDIVTEGSSLTKNYYDQFHKMLTTPGQGYPHVVKKLNEKIAKAD